MGRLQLARFALESLWRNKARSLYASIGILIAISFTASSLVAVDTSAIAAVESRLDQVTYDYVAYYDYGIKNQSMNDSEFEDVASEFESIINVDEVEGITILDSWYVSPMNQQYAPPEDMTGSSLFLMPSNSDKTLESQGINGTLPEPGTLAISRGAATAFGVHVGDRVNLSLIYRDWDPQQAAPVCKYRLNLTFPISEIWTQKVTGDYSQRPTGETSPDEVYFGSTLCSAAMNLADSELVWGPAEENETELFCVTMFNIWINRDKVISIGDLSGSLDNLDALEQKLSAKATELGCFNFYNILSGPLDELRKEIEGELLLFLSLSLPVMVLGCYLSVIGYDLGTRERRREIGVLKSRGAAGSQVFGRLILESTVLGAVSGLIGLVVGLVMSRFLLGAASAYFDYSTDASWTELWVSPWTIAQSIIFGVILMCLSSYRLLKRASKTEITEALHSYVPAETVSHYHPKWDILALLLVALCAVSVLAEQAFDLTAERRSFVIETLGMVLFAIGVSLVPVVPLLLSVSSVRLVIRGPKKTYAKLSRLFKWWTGTLHPLVEKNIERNPRRASNVSMIIALAVALSLFVSITSDSSLTYQTDSVELEIGSDVKAEGTFGNSAGPYNLSALNGVYSANGIAQVCKYRGVWTYGLISVSLMEVDVDSYQEVVNTHISREAISGSSDLEDLKENGTVIVTERFVDYHYVEIGDEIDTEILLALDGSNETTIPLSLTVIGIVADVPGLMWKFMFVSSETLGFINDSTLMSAQGGPSIGFFIDADEDHDAGVIAETARTSLAASGARDIDVRILDDEIDKVVSTSKYRSMFQFLMSEVTISILIVTIGVAMIIFVTVNDRKQELASILARGGSGYQVWTILASEALTLAVLGLVVGGIVGISCSYLFNAMYADLIGEAGRRVIVSDTSILVFVASLGAVVLAVSIASAASIKMKLAETLRIRGG